ncbi:hypothetical protein M8818_005053 [Zalaria obscura]|uniref:Uncharacterized protein n=1 Tax=Zalaria obscura TaxID=2024903 RepID=A0ACC3SED1_9PEZI
MDRPLIIGHGRSSSTSQTTTPTKATPVSLVTVKVEYATGALKQVCKVPEDRLSARSELAAGILHDLDYTEVGKTRVKTLILSAGDFTALDALEHVLKGIGAVPRSVAFNVRMPKLEALVDVTHAALVLKVSPEPKNLRYGLLNYVSNHANPVILIERLWTLFRTLDNNMYRRCLNCVGQLCFEGKYNEGQVMEYLSHREEIVHDLGKTLKYLRRQAKAAGIEQKQAARQGKKKQAEEKREQHSFELQNGLRTITEEERERLMGTGNK